VTQTLGWVATAVFVGSYFAPPAALRILQMIGAVLWVVYGVLIGAMPVIAANLLVFSAATWTLLRAPRAQTPTARRSAGTRSPIPNVNGPDTVSGST
jgi:hypothetical protein